LFGWFLVAKFGHTLLQNAQRLFKRVQSLLAQVFHVEEAVRGAIVYDGHFYAATKRFDSFCERNIIV
jgi:hypothetical protein